MNMSSTQLVPRLVRPVNEPLGLFLKASRSDHRILCQLLSEERAAMSGVVFDPEYVDFQEELRSEARQRNLEVVLDPRFMELATPVGLTDRRAALPWGSPRPHTLSDLVGSGGGGVVEAVAEFVVANRFTAVLAPTHFLADGPQDPWFGLDLSLTRKLRDYLDAGGASDVAIYYPLAIPTRVFFDGAHLSAFRGALQGMRIDAIWLRIHPFGSDSGHLTLQRYIVSCRDLHGLSLPLVAERTGNVGLALLAFGAVGGIESGVSSGEKFDFSRLTRKYARQQAFAPHGRVYIPTLGVFLPRARQAVFRQPHAPRPFRL